MSLPPSQPPHGAARPEPGIPAHLVDAFFDRELSRTDCQKFMRMLGRDRTAASEVARTQRAIGALRRDVRAPDLSREILAGVALRTPLLTRRSVRHVRWTRIAAMAALVALVGGAFIAQRLDPAITSIASEPAARPISNLASALPMDTADAIDAVRHTAEGVRTSVVARSLVAVPSAQAARSRLVRVNTASLLPRMAQNPVPDDMIFAEPDGWAAQSITWSASSLGCGSGTPGGCAPQPASASMLLIEPFPARNDSDRTIMGVK